MPDTVQGEVTVAQTEVNDWSTRVCIPGGGGPADSCPRVVDEIMDAADAADVCVEPYFRSRTARHDADEAVLFLPVICLLVRRDGDLAGIYPVTRDGERFTVEDGLDRLERGADPRTL